MRTPGLLSFEAFWFSTRCPHPIRIQGEVRTPAGLNHAQNFKHERTPTAGRVLIESEPTHVSNDYMLEELDLLNAHRALRGGHTGHKAGNCHHLRGADRELRPSAPLAVTTIRDATNSVVLLNCYVSAILFALLLLVDITKHK